jgi:site-specific DNA recombinase
VDRRKELTGLACSIQDFCARLRQGLEQASFEQKRQLVELLIDRVIVTEAEVEIRYVVPTGLAKSAKQARNCSMQEVPA